MIDNVFGITSVADAKKLGNDLIKAKLITHCSSDRLPFTKACFYRFTSPPTTSTPPTRIQSTIEQAEVLPGVLIYGGSGGLGSVVVDQFKKAKWKVITVDRRKSMISHHSIVVKGDGSKADTDVILKEITELGVGIAFRIQLLVLNTNETILSDIEAVISVAGGFCSTRIDEDSIFESMDRMIQQNITTAISAAHVASHCLKDGGMLALTGSAAALGI